MSLYAQDETQDARPHSQDFYFSNDPNFPTLGITVIMLVGAFFGYLNETLLNVALTGLMAEFHVEKTTVQWVVTSFLLMMGAMTPLTANVIQWFSTKTMLLLTLSTFVVGTLVCGLAPSFGWVLVGRVIQGLSAAFMMPMVFNSMLLIYPPERRGVVFGVITMMFMLAPAIGPTLSGVIVDAFGWRFLFFFTLPFIMLAMILAFFILKVNLQPITRPAIDVPSVLLSSLGLGLLVVAVSFFEALPLMGFLGLMGMCGVLLVGFVWRQFRLTTPLVDLRVFFIKEYRVAMAMLTLLGFVFVGTEVVMPMYLQQAVLLSATTTGLVLLPGAVAQGILSPVAGRLLDKHGARVIALPAAVLMFLCFGLMLGLYRVDTPVLILAGVFMLLPISIVGILVAETQGLNALPQAMYPHGTTIITTINPTAAALGAAVFVGLTEWGEANVRQAATTAQDALMTGVMWAFFMGLFGAALMVFLASRLAHGVIHHQTDQSDLQP